MLVATDVAARGLDVPEVAHVVQVLLLASSLFLFARARSLPSRSAPCRSGARSVCLSVYARAVRFCCLNARSTWQFDLPVGDDFDSYVHRIGRTGRAGHQGRATALYVHGFDPKTGTGERASPTAARFRVLCVCARVDKGGTGGGRGREEGKEDRSECEHVNHV